MAQPEEEQREAPTSVQALTSDQQAKEEVKGQDETLEEQRRLASELESIERERFVNTLSNQNHL